MERKGIMMMMKTEQYLIEKKGMRWLEKIDEEAMERGETEGCNGKRKDNGKGRESN